MLSSFRQIVVNQWKADFKMNLKTHEERYIILLKLKRSTTVTTNNVGKMSTLVVVGNCHRERL